MKIKCKLCGHWKKVENPVPISEQHKGYVCPSCLSIGEEKRKKLVPKIDRAPLKITLPSTDSFNYFEVQRRKKEEQEEEDEKNV